MPKARRLSVLVVENGSGVSALACESESKCGVGRATSTEGAVSASVRALESGRTVAKSEAREILDRADDAWSEEFRRSALSGSSPRRRVARRKRSR
jgi:hypothetical protein